MERIEQAATRMGGLVDDLVLLARLDQGRPLEAGPVDLAAVVAESVADARAVEPNRVIHIAGLAGGTAHGEIAWASAHADAGGPTTHGDAGGPELASDVDAVVTGEPARLRQVVDNLLANVREHTDASTVVTVTLASRRRDVVLVVTDDGPGMTEAEAARAFDRFWQAAATEQHPRRGTGLGLAIVADLVAAHGGEISLDAAPGAGTRVTIRLPRAGTSLGGRGHHSHPATGRS
jgi:two-component system OmpR family sensor kinase